MKILAIISWILVAAMLTLLSAVHEDYDWKEYLLVFLGANLTMCFLAAAIVLTVVTIKLGISINFS